MTKPIEEAYPAGVAWGNTGVNLQQLRAVESMLTALSKTNYRTTQRH